jgi:two-component system chemotaxis response regulator CheY
MVTAEAEQHQVVEALQAGVDNYVVKPFTVQILNEKLEAIYKKRIG